MEGLKSIPVLDFMILAEKNKLLLEGIKGFLLALDTIGGNVDEFHLWETGLNDANTELLKAGFNKSQTDSILTDAINSMGFTYFRF